MIVAVIGAGGVGGYIGMRLAQAGNDVRFLARGRTRDALRSRGLRVMTPEGLLELPHILASDSANELGRADVVIVTVKIYDLAAIAPDLVPLIGPDTSVLPLQNGVEAHGILCDALHTDAVLNGTIAIKSHVVEPGFVICKSPFCRIKLGSRNPDGANKAARVVDLLNDSRGIEACLSSNIERDIWLKFLMLSSFSAVSCLARATIGEVHANHDAYSLVVDAATEAAKVGSALGIDLPDDVGEVVYKQIVDMPRDGRPSMLEDLEAGRRLEIGWLSGAVVRLGATVGVRTPLHSVALRALAIHANGRPVPEQPRAPRI